MKTLAQDRIQFDITCDGCRDVVLGAIELGSWMGQFFSEEHC